MTTATNLNNNNNRGLIRNISVIAHVDHGKSTLCDNLLSKAGELNEKSVGKCALDEALVESAERGITIVASAVTLQYEVDHETLQQGRTLAIERMQQLHLAPITSSSTTTIVESLSSATDSDESDEDDSSSSLALHVENIPFECDIDRLRQSLTSQLPLSSSSSSVVITMRKNHSARVVVNDKTDIDAISARLAASTLRVLIDGNELRITQSTGRSLLANVLLRAKQCNVTPLPTFDVVESSIEEGKQFVCNGVVGKTRRDARQAAALAFLSTLPSSPSPSSPQTIPLIESLPSDASRLTVNLIDSPGHVDFSAEVTSALRLTDGAVVVVDAVEGIAAQTVSVLRQALRERVRCICFVNKIDRAIGELQLNALDMTRKLEAVVDGVNVSLAGSQAPVSFANGTVAFGSALEGWAVSLDAFCALLRSRGDIDVAPIRAKLEEGDEAVMQNIVMQPIFKLRTAIANGEFESAMQFLNRVKRAPSGRNLEQWRALIEKNDRKHLVRLALKLMYPLADALSAMMVKFLPSPLEAQRVRADVLYKPPTTTHTTTSSSSNGDVNDDDGDVAKATTSKQNVDEEEHEQRVEAHLTHDDVALRAIRLCDPTGPAMLFASKQIMINNRMHSIGRLFAGTIRVGDELYIHDGEGATVRKARVGGLVVPTVRGSIRVDVASAGMIVAVAGIGLTGGTATSSSVAAPFCTMRALVSEVVGLVLKLGPGAKGDARKKLIDSARALAASDVALRVVQSANGELMIRGVGELHLEIALSRLRTTSNIPIEASQPVVSLREAVLEGNTRSYFGKSSNKHNRVYFMCEPIKESLAIDLEAASTEREKRAVLTQHGYSVADSKRVLGFAGVSAMLLDRTQGVSVAPISDSLLQAFRAVAEEGVLARQQPLAAVALVLTDCKYHADAKHRAPMDIVPAATRAMTAALLATKIRLLEVF